MILNQKTGIYYRNPNYGKDPNPFVPDISFLNRGGKTEGVNRKNKSSAYGSTYLEPGHKFFYRDNLTNWGSLKDDKGKNGIIVLGGTNKDAFDWGYDGAKTVYSIPSWTDGHIISPDELRQYLSNRNASLLSPDMAIYSFTTINSSGGQQDVFFVTYWRNPWESKNPNGGSNAPFLHVSEWYKITK